MTDWREEHDRMMREHDERMARAFGRRPRGQEHRAWVDHPGLRALHDDHRELAAHLKFCGLSDLPTDDPSMPAELRALLAATSAGWAFTLGISGTFFIAGYGAALAALVGWFGIRPIGEAMVMAFLPAFILTMVGLTTVGEHLEKYFKAWTGAAPPGTRERALSRALDALIARPFVVRIGDVLVENLPSLSQLDAWQEELRSELDQAEDRERALDDLLQRIRGISAELGERAETDHTRALREAVAAEQALQARGRRLISDLQARAGRMHAELAELRQRAELDALRAKADATLGRPRSEADVAIQTAIDLDVGELGAEVEALRAELKDERLRARALTEVGAIRSG